MAIRKINSELPQNTAEYELATQVALHLARRLNSIGVKTVVDTQEQARAVLSRNESSLSFSADNSESTGIAKDFTGWKVYPQCKTQKECDEYAKDIKGSIWRPNLLWKNDIHTYFEKGQAAHSVFVKDGEMIDMPFGCTLKDELERVYPYMLEKGIRMPEGYVTDMENLRKLQEGKMTWKEAFEMPMARYLISSPSPSLAHSDDYHYSTRIDFYSWDEYDKEILKKIDAIVESSKEERWKSGYYTAEEISQLAPDVSEITGIRGEVVNIDISMPNLKMVNANYLIFSHFADVDKLRKVTGVLKAKEDAIVIAGSLEDVRSIVGYNNGTVYANALKECRGILLSDSSKCYVNQLRSVEFLELDDSSQLYATSLKRIGIWDSGRMSNYVRGLNAENVEYIGSSIEIDKKNECLFQNLHKADSIHVGSGELNLGKLEYVRNLNLGECGKLKAERLNSVESLTMAKGSCLESETLTHLGKVWIYGNNAEISSPCLRNIDEISIFGNDTKISSSLQNVGKIEICPNLVYAQLGSISKVEGDVQICAGSKVVFDSLREIGGELIVGERAKVVALNLESVKGGIFVMDNAVYQFGNKDLEKDMNVVDANSRTAWNKDMLDYPFHTSDGTVYGYVKDNTIHLTPEGMNPETPIHEYTHLWLHAMRVQRPEEWKEFEELAKTIPEWETVSNNPVYSHLDDVRKVEEVLATAVGKDASKLIYEAATQAGESGSLTVARAVEYIQSSLTEYACGLCGLVPNFRTDLTMQVLYDMVNKTDLRLDLQKSKKEEMAAQVKGELPSRRAGTMRL